MSGSQSALIERQVSNAGCSNCSTGWWVSHPRPRLPIRWSTVWLCLIMEESQTRFSRPRTRTSVRLNAVRSRPETDGIVGESNLAKTGGTQARAVHGTIASNADSALRLMRKPGAACSSSVYLGRFQNNIHEITTLNIVEELISSTSTIAPSTKIFSGIPPKPLPSHCNLEFAEHLCGVGRDSKSSV